MDPYKILLPFCLMLTISLSAQQNPAADSIKANGTAFTKVDVEASFPDGEMGWRTFLQKNLNATVPIDNGAPMGLYTVIAQFVVDTSGKISDLKTLTSMGYGVEKEVIRVLQRSGLWKPAILDGKPIRAYRKQPVSFMVEEDGIDFISARYFTLFEDMDNEISIKVRKVTSDNIGATISKGTITKGADGKFIARVPRTEAGVIIEIFNTAKNDKPLGSAHFVVRPLAEVPRPKNN